MKIKCMIPYYDYNDNSFEVDESYYGNNGYEIALKESYNAMNSIQNGVMYNYDMKGIKNSENDFKLSYASCDAILYNSNGDEETIEKLIGYTTLDEPYFCALEFDDFKMDEQFEYELKNWCMLYKKLSNLPISDELKFEKQTPMDLKFKFSDNLGFETCIDCKGAKIIFHDTVVGLIIDKLEMNKCND